MSSGNMASVWKRRRRSSTRYLVDQKSDDPEQLRAIGWSRGRLCSVVFEIRHDSEGEYVHLVTAWKTTQQEEQYYAENV